MLQKIEVSLPESTSKDTLKQILKHYKFYDRTQLISALTLVFPKNQSMHHVILSPLYQQHVKDRHLKDLLYKQTKKRLKAISKQLKTKKSKINKKDNLHMVRPINRNTFPENHPLRNTRIPLPLREAPWWMWGINGNQTTYRTFNQIKDLIALSFIEHNKIMVVRMDFYLPEEDKKDISKVNKYFNNLMANTVYNLNYYLDYLCCKEYTEECGIHLHCLFLLDGSKIKNELEFISTVGKRWDRIVDKEHSWYSANLHKRKYPDLAPCLGILEYRNFFQIERLIHYCKYFIKHLNDRDWLDKVEGATKQTKLFTMSFISDRMYQIDENEKRFKEGTGTNRKYHCSFSWLNHLKLSTTYTIFKPLYYHSDRIHFGTLIDIREFIKPNPCFTGREKDLVEIEQNDLYYSR
nr:MAG TPA: Inovirus Gp2 [Caudoviricetes sp.]